MPSRNLQTIGGVVRHQALNECFGLATSTPKVASSLPHGLRYKLGSAAYETTGSAFS